MRRAKPSEKLVTHTRVITDKIAKQCALPEGVLFFEIVALAIKDAFLSRKTDDRASARRYLQGTLCRTHTEMLGVGYEWFVLQLKKLKASE